MHRGPGYVGETAGATSIRPEEISIRASLELCGSVWGEVWFPAQLRQASCPYDIPLFAHDTTANAGDVDKVNADIRAEMVMRIDWSKNGARLELLRVRGLTLPIARIGEMLHPDGETTWTMRFEAAPPVKGLPVAVCTLQPNSVPVLFTEHQLVFERIVELQWPPDWLVPPVEDEADLSEPLPPTVGNIRTTTRLRRAMLEGSGSRACARSLKQWAMNETWFLFSPPFSRYDEWLLPIDEVTANCPNSDFCLAPEDLMELRSDAHYLQCHEYVARRVLLSWGWDVDLNAGVDPLDNEGGQGWHASGALSWRLRHLCLSLRLFSQVRLMESIHQLLKIMGPLVPWGEDGSGEARFTLGEVGAQHFLESEQRLRHVPYRCLVTESRDRTLREIIFTPSALDC